MNENLISVMKWDANGLAPAICQDAATGQVLMLAWMNEEALRRTLEKGTVHFWSRSRGELWQKGETSGNYLRLVTARLDCDGDALLFLVHPDGPACHTDRMSCFFNEVVPAQGGGAGGAAGEELPFDQNLLESIYRLIRKRRETGGEESYVARLFRAGEDRILKKVGEEAGEVILGVKNADREEISREVADLWFHSMVAMAVHDVPPGKVFAELARRFGKGGRKK